jgi:hypothetical protein
LLRRRAACLPPRRRAEACGFAGWHSSFRAATFFGFNAVPSAVGLVRRGEQVAVLQEGSEPPLKPVSPW